MQPPGALQLVTPPAIEPVTLAEAKLFLRLDTTADDALVTSLIAAARRQVEQILARALITQTWNYLLDGFFWGSFPLAYSGGPFPLGYGLRTSERLPTAPWLELPKAPLQSVVSLKYLDGAGALQTLAGSAYTVDAISEPGRIMPVVGTSWPLTQAVPNAVTVQFKAGYGDAAAAIPDDILVALKMVLNVLYEYRSEDGTIPNAVTLLLQPYRMSMV